MCALISNSFKVTFKETSIASSPGFAFVIFHNTYVNSSSDINIIIKWKKINKFLKSHTSSLFTLRYHKNCLCEFLLPAVRKVNEIDNKMWEWIAKFELFRKIRKIELYGCCVWEREKRRKVKTWYIYRGQMFSVAQMDSDPKGIICQYDV